MSYDPMMADFLSEAFADNGVWTAQIFYKKAIDLMLKGKTKGHKSLVGPVPKLWLLGGQPETTPLYKKCYRTWEL